MAQRPGCIRPRASLPKTNVGKDEGMSSAHHSKTCTRCGARKTITDFHRKAENPDGRRNICRACCVEQGRKYRADNPDAVAASKRRWVERNEDAAREIVRRTREKNRSRYSRIYSAKEVRQRDPEAYARLMSKWAKRRAHQIMAIPLWFDAEKVNAIYRQAGRMRRAGFDVHVDHIIPLRGQNVCGLHVHNNLRVINATENMAKGAKLLAGVDRMSYSAG